MKRILFTGVMSCLTVTAMSACNWQYRRYQESIRKWKLIDEQFKPDHPIQHMGIQDILSLDPQRYSYILVKTSGTLDKYILKVYRYQDGRPGMMLCGILRDDQNDAIVVNLGWVPENYLDKIESVEGMQLNEMCAMIKLPEHPDKNTDQNLMNTFVDLGLIAKENKLPEKSTNLFLERIGTSTENAGLFKAQDLYPVPSFYSTFQKPYLTPDKHKAYYWFWGSCSCLGILQFMNLINNFYSIYSIYQQKDCSFDLINNLTYKKMRLINIYKFILSFQLFKNSE